jgi:polysaccharide biosynthesis/export protein
MSLVLLFQISSAQTAESTAETQFSLDRDMQFPNEVVETIPSNVDSLHDDLEKNVPDVLGEIITIPEDDFLDESGFVDSENEFIVDVDIDDDITDPIHYRLRVGDILILAIYGELDTFESVAIDPSGNISYLFAHDIKAYGKTIAELREELKSHLEKYYKYPIVLITPEQFVPQYYTILGEVNSPGIKQIRGNSSLIKAFAESGGFSTRIYRDQTMFTVDFDRCFLSRKGECLLKIDFEELMNGDFSQNVKLESEDFIYIASNDKQRVFVLGEVVRPGTYDYFGSMSLVEALALSGGLRADASSRVSVIRGALTHPTQYLIDVNLIMRGRARDFALKPSDIVYFPPRRFTNLRLFAQAAIRGFVGNATSQAGNSAFIQTTPAAAGERATGSTLDFGPASSPSVIVP